jgi:hypothetical protein
MEFLKKARGKASGETPTQCGVIQPPRVQRPPLPIFTNPSAHLDDSWVVERFPFGFRTTKFLVAVGSSAVFIAGGSFFYFSGIGAKWTVDGIPGNYVAIGFAIFGALCLLMVTGAWLFSKISPRTIDIRHDGLQFPGGMYRRKMEFVPWLDVTDVTVDARNVSGVTLADLYIQASGRKHRISCYALPDDKSFAHLVEMVRAQSSRKA